MLYFAPWKIAVIFGVILIGALFSLPNLFPESARFQEVGGEREPVGVWRYLPNKGINLGLDLQGGAHLVFELDVEELTEIRLENLTEEVRAALRQDPPIVTAPPAVVNDEVIVRVSRSEDFQEALSRLEDLNRPVERGGLGPSLDQALSIEPGDDGRTIRLSVTEPELNAVRARAVGQAMQVIRLRIDATGVTEPTIARQGADRVLVQVPGEADPVRIRELVSTAARMTFHLVESGVDPGPDGQAATPPGVMILPQDNPGEPFLAVERRPIVTGEQLVSAAPGTDPDDGSPAVNFRFNTSGARAFGEVTSQHVGERFAIALDGVIISAPVIRQPILGGSGQISGRFTYQEATDLANLLSAGALPASLTAVEERTVGPGLGRDSIARGQVAIAIGFSLVIVFMALAYGFFGVVATTVLLVNVVLIVGALSGLQATLTLPGIAGVILTIGMAVDANVLIFERIREELRNGRTVINAVDAGYNRAFAAIIDANVTTFIAAAVLYFVGAGPVRGFAVTLGIGILTSVFTAFVFSRFLIAQWVRARRPKTLALAKA